MSVKTEGVDFSPWLVRAEGSAVVATIARPEAMNALNQAVLSSLDRLLTWVEKSGARALILTGAGEKAFVAGADIKQFESMTSDAALTFAREGQRIFMRLEALPIPVIAAVNGFALGGGLELALACDFIYASDNAKFGLPEGTLGLMPGFGGTVRLPRRVGVARARELSFLGAMIPAHEALIYGLVNKVVKQSDLLGACIETAQKIAAACAPHSVGSIKRSIHMGMSMSERDANDFEAKLFGHLFELEDKSEGVKAFIEKRKPTFQGR